MRSSAVGNRAVFMMNAGSRTCVGRIGRAMRDPCALLLLVCVFAASSTTALSTQLASRQGTNGQLSSEPGSGTVRARAHTPGPHQVYITARDGVQLHTVYTLPGPEDTKYTVVIDRSPYGEFGTGTYQLADPASQSPRAINLFRMN